MNPETPEAVADAGTFTGAGIRRERLKAGRAVIYQRRRLAALAKMEEGITELEQVEREIEALDAGTGAVEPGYRAPGSGAARS